MDVSKDYVEPGTPGTGLESRALQTPDRNTVAGTLGGHAEDAAWAEDTTTGLIRETSAGDPFSGLHDQPTTDGAGNGPITAMNAEIHAREHAERREHELENANLQSLADRQALSFSNQGLPSLQEQHHRVELLLLDVTSHVEGLSDKTAGSTKAIEGGQYSEQYTEVVTPQYHETQVYHHDGYIPLEANSVAEQATAQVSSMAEVQKAELTNLSADYPKSAQAVITGAACFGGLTLLACEEEMSAADMSSMKSQNDVLYTSRDPQLVSVDGTLQYQQSVHLAHVLQSAPTIYVTSQHLQLGVASQ
ncbi:hypothetical protein GUITHDRAFT_148863, partial [Guillardia theta CCMP2712]